MKGMKGAAKRMVRKRGFKSEMATRRKPKPAKAPGGMVGKAVKKLKKKGGY